MKIGIVGMGTVGNAIYLNLTTKCRDSGIIVKGYDKFKNIGSLEEIIDSNIIFLCLPTIYRLRD